MKKSRVLAGMMACAMVCGVGFGTAHFAQKEYATVMAAEGKSGIIPFSISIPSNA